MPNPLRRRARRMLNARYDELRERYLRYRRRVERLIRDPHRFTSTTYAFLAAAQAALEAAFEDAVISYDDHVWLLQAYTLVFIYSVDVYSECEAGFEVQICHPLGSEAKPSHVETYLAAARSTRAELAGRRDDIVEFYDLGVWTHDVLTSPYRITTAATLHWARARRGLSGATAKRLDVYFAAMDKLVDIEELQLLDTASFLAECLNPGSNTDDPARHPYRENTLDEEE